MNVVVRLFTPAGPAGTFYTGPAAGCPPIPRIGEEVQLPGGVVGVQRVLHRQAGPGVIEIDIML